jgi:peptide/nickel transport system permease protein
MVIIGLTSWTSDARFIRAEFLRLRNQDFVQAARAAGLPLRSVIFRHMLPNGIAPVLVAASFGVASAILTESVLSFLGLGLVQEPSWGGMLNQARGAGGNFSWWIAVFPGTAIFLTVFAYNLIGEALRDALDPKLRKFD